MRKILTGAALVLAAAVLAMAPAAAEYPDKPVQFIVPWPPGNLEDVLTRLIAEEMQAQTGVAAAVVNKPGGGGGPFPGAAVVAGADPDGSTIGSFVIGVPTVGPLLGIQGFTKQTFEPVGIFLTYPFVLAAKGDAPYSNMAELAAHAKGNKVALGHFGYGLVPTRASVLAGRELGMEFGSEAAFDALDCNTLASGDADVINTTIQLVLPCLDEIKVIAALTDQRIALIPDIKTLGEQVPGVDVALWNGLFVPEGTPQEVKDKVAAIAEKVVMGDKAKDVAAQTGAIIYWQDQASSEARVAADYAKVEDMFRKMGDL